MTDTPSAYMVAAIFGAAPTTRLCLNAVVAPTPEAAVAIAITAFVQQLGITEPIQGVNVQKLEPAFMRAALNGGDGKVVPLAVVPQEENPLNQMAQAGPLAWCSSHMRRYMPGEGCPDCKAENPLPPWPAPAGGRGRPYHGGAQHSPGSTPTG